MYPHSIAALYSRAFWLDVFIPVICKAPIKEPAIRPGEAARLPPYSQTLRLDQEGDKHHFYLQNLNGDTQPTAKAKG